MTIPLNSFPASRPYSNVQPFTVRAGATHMLQIETLVKWIRDVLVPHIDKETGGLAESWEAETQALIESWETQATNLVNTVNAAVAGVEDMSAVATAARDEAEAARDLAELFASTAVEMQDTAIAQIFNNSASAFRTSIEDVFATRSEHSALQGVVDGLSTSLDTVSTELDTVSTSVEGVSTAVDTISEEMSSGRLSENGLTTSAVMSNRSQLGVFSVASFGAVADFNGVSGTDSWQAFVDTIAATPEGGTVWVPPGRYYLSQTLVINKAIDFTCGAGGLTTGPSGTELNFPDISGIRVEQGSAPYRPAKWRIGPFRIKSVATGLGESTGILVTAGRGIIDRATVENFSLHGVHIRAGSSAGGNNANNTEISGVRVYQNYGDGIRVEGSDANACMLTKVDVVANSGWGINLVGASMTKVIAAHADQQYGGSPGAFRDAGNSNDWDWVYSEGGAPMLIDTGSSNGRLSASAYGQPSVQTSGSGFLSWRIELAAGKQHLIQLESLEGSKTWNIRPGSFSADSFDLIQQSDSLRALTIDASVTRAQWYVNLVPNVNGERDLGSSSLRWRNLYLSGYARVGAVATPARPAASAAGAGAHMFDTTLKKPIWSTGAVWVDATGATV